MDVKHRQWKSIFGGDYPPGTNRIYCGTTGYYRLALSETLSFSSNIYLFPRRLRKCKPINTLNHQIASLFVRKIGKYPATKRFGQRMMFVCIPQIIPACALDPGKKGLVTLLSEFDFTLKTRRRSKTGNSYCQTSNSGELSLHCMLCDSVDTSSLKLAWTATKIHCLFLSAQNEEWS